jgi:uncharacterized protein
MATAEPELRVIDNPDESRYELWMGDRLAGFADYRLSDGQILLPYVEIDPVLQGRGLGGVLTGAVLDACRARGLTVGATCPFVVSFLQAHHEYDDIVASA